MHAYRGRPEWGSVKAQNEAMKDVFARCPEKIAVQLCIIILYLVVASFEYLHFVPLSLYQGNQYMMLIVVYFSQVKNKP
jgi:hypothetical protein